MKLKYLIYTITLTSLTACSDFLEPKSQSKYIPKDANALQEIRSLPAPACIAERRPRGQRQPLDLFGACAHIHPVSLLFLSFSLLSARGRSQCRVCGYCNRFALSKGENPCLFVRKCFDLSYGNFWYLSFFCLASTLP